MLMAVTTFAMLFATNDIVSLVCSFLTGFIFATWFAFIFSVPKEGRIPVPPVEVRSVS